MLWYKYVIKKMVFFFLYMQQNFTVTSLWWKITLCQDLKVSDLIPLENIRYHSGEVLTSSFVCL